MTTNMEENYDAFMDKTFLIILELLLYFQQYQENVFDISEKFPYQM